MLPGEGGRAAGATGDDPFLDFGDEEDLEVIKRKQEEQFDFSGKFLSSAQRPAHQSEPDGKKGKAKQNGQSIIQRYKRHAVLFVKQLLH